MVDTSLDEDVAIENILQQGRELREKVRSIQQGVPKLPGYCGVSTPVKPRQRAHIPYNPPTRRKTPTEEKRNDDQSIQEVQRQGRRIRELLRINAAPKPADQSRTATPVRGRHSSNDLLLRTPVRSPSLSSRGVDVDKWSNQVSSRSSDASTMTPSQTSARSLRCTPGASPQSSARSMKTSMAGSPPLSGRPPRAPACSPKLRPELHEGSPVAIAKRSEKAGRRNQSHYIPPVPSSVLLLPERMAEAARHGDVEITRQCISELPAGAPVCEKDAYGWSSLHYAASGGHFEVCQLLLEARGDANVELPDFSTPIMLAVEEGNMPVAQLLLQHGAQTRSKDEAGFTVVDRCAPAALQEFTRLVQEYQ